MSPKRRGRPGKIEPYARQIAGIWKHHLGWSDVQIQKELFRYVAAQVQQEYQDKKWPIDQSEIEAEARERLPSVYSIAEYRRRVLEPNQKSDEGAERPWHLGLFPSHPEVMPEAVPYILLAQGYGAAHLAEPFMTKPNEPLSIRQAVWISRLYALIDMVCGRGGLFSKREKVVAKLGRYLWSWSKAYATYETLNRLAGLTDTFGLEDSSVLDAGLAAGRLPVTVGDTIVMFDLKKRMYSLVSGDKHLVEQIREMKKESDSDEGQHQQQG